MAVVRRIVVALVLCGLAGLRAEDFLPGCLTWLQPRHTLDTSRGHKPGTKTGETLMKPTSIVAAVLALALPAICPAASYTVTDLGTLGGTYSQAYGLNNAGQVTGVGDTADGLRAFVWQNGVMTGLGTLGGSYSYGLGINDAGQIVGESRTVGSSVNDAFLWQNGAMSDLGMPGAVSSASAINNSAQIVGFSQASDSPSRAVLWQNGVMSNVGGPSSIGSAINNSGQAAGGTRVGPTGEFHPFIWQQNASATDLDPLGGPEGYANGINNFGQAVGFSSVSTSSHAFLWQNGGRTDLGTLGGPFSNAYSIRDDGQILGTSSFSSDTSHGHAFLWDSQHGMRDLNNLIDIASGWTLQDARQMNDAGQIVGIGINPDGAQHGYLLNPVPEPSGIVLAAFGLLGLVVWGWRRRKCA